MEVLPKFTTSTPLSRNISSPPARCQYGIEMTITGRSYRQTSSFLLSPPTPIQYKSYPCRIYLTLSIPNNIMAPAHIVHGESVVNIVHPSYARAGNRPMFSRQSVCVQKLTHFFEKLAHNTNLTMPDHTALLYPAISSNPKHNPIRANLGERIVSKSAYGSSLTHIYSYSCI